MISSIFMAVNLISTGYSLGKKILEDVQETQGNEAREELRKKLVKAKKTERRDLMKKALEDKIRAELEEEYKAKLPQVKKRAKK